MNSSNSIRQPARSFRDLVVWQRAHQLVLAVYRLTRTFPKEELFGIVSQLRRSAASVAANIAEGFAKKSKADKARFYNIAQGSLEEVHYYLILAGDLGYAATESLIADSVEVGRLLSRYSKAMLSSPNPAP